MKYTNNNFDKRAMALEGIRRIHDSVMEEFKPDFSIFDGLTEEEMWLMFFMLNQMRRKNERHNN